MFEETKTINSNQGDMTAAREVKEIDEDASLPHQSCRKHGKGKRKFHRSTAGEKAHADDITASRILEVIDWIFPALTPTI
jgi:hypothetical protein